MALMLLDDKFQTVLTVKLYLTHGWFWDWWWIYSTPLPLVQFEHWNEWNALPISVRQSGAHSIFKKNGLILFDKLFCYSVLILFYSQFFGEES